MEDLIRLWLNGMKWLAVFFMPIGFIIMLALPIWTSIKPWETAKEKLNEKYSPTLAVQIAGGSSSHWTPEEKTESRSATYILFPQVFSTFEAVTFYEEKKNGELNQKIFESTGVLVWMLFFNSALILISIFWSYPKIKGLFKPNGLEPSGGLNSVTRSALH